MIEKMNKMINEKEKRHGMPYGYFLNKVFDQFGVIGTKGTPVIVK